MGKKAVGIILGLSLLAGGIYLVWLGQQGGALESVGKDSLAPMKAEKSFPESEQTGKAVAEDASDIVAQANPRGISSQIEKTLSQWYNKPISEVIREKEEFLKKTPDAETHFELGKIYLLQPSKRSLAYFHLTKTLEFCPEHPQKDFLEMWIEQLRAEQENRKILPRIKELTEKLEQTSEDPELYCELGALYQKLDDSDRAIDYYKKR